MGYALQTWANVRLDASTVALYAATLQVREHSSAVERCGPHVAISPAMLRSSNAHAATLQPLSVYIIKWALSIEHTLPAWYIFVGAFLILLGVLLSALSWRGGTFIYRDPSHSPLAVHP